MMLGPGTGCGRRMGDVTSVFVIQLYELYEGTADRALLSELFPAAARGARWAMRNADNGTGLPQGLQCTYDQYAFQIYNHTTYNSVLYLAMLRACVRLAQEQSDESLRHECEAAFSRGTQRFSQMMWRESDQFFGAVWDHQLGLPPWLMGDSLFGHVVGQHLGLGELFANSSARVRSHLAAEQRHLFSPVGVRTVSDTSNLSHCPISYSVGGPKCEDAAPGGTGSTKLCDEVWGQASPSWTANAIRLDRSAAGTAEVLGEEMILGRYLQNWRTVIHDAW